MNIRLQITALIVAAACFAAPSLADMVTAEPPIPGAPVDVAADVTPIGPAPSSPPPVAPTAPAVESEPTGATRPEVQPAVGATGSTAAPVSPTVHSPTASPAPPDSYTPETAADQPPATRQADSPGPSFGFHLPLGLGGPEEWTSPEGLSSSLQSLLLLAVVSLAPAVLLMTTSFVRIVVVLGLLRQAIGTQQLPSNQIVTSLALFMTLLIMAPVWNRVYQDAVVPYTSHEITVEEAWNEGVTPVRAFMSAQIERTGNSEDIWLFYKYLPKDTPSPTSYDDVPLRVLLPAYLLSELKTAFLIGFQIFLPFLVIDLVVASVTISMGMFMLPPVLVSLPLKLLLFVLVDGWHLVVGMLLDSFQIVT